MSPFSAAVMLISREISINDNYLLKALENIADEATDVVIMFSVD